MLLDKRRVSAFTKVGAVVLAAAFILSMAVLVIPSIEGDLGGTTQNAQLEAERQQLLSDVKAYRQSLKMFPKIGANWAALGETYVKLAGLEEQSKAPQKALTYWGRAVVAFEKAIKLRPRSATSRTQLAYGYIQTGRPTQALEQLAVADRLSPKDPNVYFGLGLAYQATGKKAKAIAALKSFLKLEKGTDRATYAKQLLAQIEGGPQGATAGTAPATGSPGAGTAGTGSTTRNPLQIPPSTP